MPSPSGLFVLSPDAYDLAYGPDEREAIGRLATLIAPPKTPEELARRPVLLGRAEVLFSGWGAPVVDAPFLDLAPRLRAVFYAAGATGSWLTRAAWDRGLVVTTASAANAVPVAEYTLAAILFSLKHGRKLARQTRAEQSYPPRDNAPGSVATDKPPAVDVVVKGKPAPLDKAGMAEMGVTLLPDGVTWKAAPVYLETAPLQLGFGDQPLGHAEAPVYFRVTSGAIKQAGIDTFRVWLGRGGIERQGNPWDPWAIATSSGDGTYRAADRPVHFWVPIRRKDGTPQSINFPDVPPVPVAATTVKLNATADSGLPVQYYVVSGPADVADDGTVTLAPIPPHAKYPVKVTVGAYQWGRGLDPKVASAEPVVRDFVITK